MSNSPNQNSEHMEKAAGRLLPLIGGFIGIAIGMVASRIVFPPITIYEMTTGGCFGRTSQVSFASVAIIIGSGITGLMALSYLAVKYRERSCEELKTK